MSSSWKSYLSEEDRVSQISLKHFKKILTSNSLLLSLRLIVEEARAYFVRAMISLRWVIFAKISLLWLEKVPCGQNTAFSMVSSMHILWGISGFCDWLNSMDFLKGSIVHMTCSELIQIVLFLQQKKSMIFSLLSMMVNEYSERGTLSRKHISQILLHLLSWLLGLMQMKQLFRHYKMLIWF